MRGQARVLLVDYGEVISLPQPESSLARMASAAGLERAEFVRRYWERRREYDAGQSARDYWAGVLGREPDDELLERLITEDVASWLVMNDDTLAVLRAAAARGLTLALLSNAPHELADALDSDPALAFFDRRFYSARFGLTKPDSAVYLAVLAELGRRAAEVVFVDDRPENVGGAAQLGLGAILFTSPAALAHDLAG
jgi:putative hydrolase of the HAD superfamily